ncbi:hypothetical protein EXN66_Car015196 [Channa argus]|uniref:Uncharacterized protein n=1 Tax=Channa argus TaxID=215402 RepID=A0A6G1QAS2_CHAAH|nr:hypothetical protein EXN66_Car015196 [Channa argus]
MHTHIHTPTHTFRTASLHLHTEQTCTIRHFYTHLYDCTKPFCSFSIQSERWDWGCTHVLGLSLYKLCYNMNIISV